LHYFEIQGGLRTWKTRSGSKRTSGAEARIHFNDLTARLKIVPFPIPLNLEFFRTSEIVPFPKCSWYQTN